MHHPLAADTLINERYKILHKIGEGGFGSVYQAVQLSTDQRVAIKVLHDDPDEDPQDAEIRAARFRREMKVITQLHHPNLVHVLDGGCIADTGQLYMVLEFIQGEELKSYIERHGTLSVRATIHIMTQVLDALHTAHQQGIVHRDLKPQNIMVTSSGMRPNAVVLDFGIAAIVEEARDADYKTLTAAGKIQGTPHYMAPEQITRTQLSPATDLYAWGLIVLECLIGKSAIPASTLAELIGWQLSPEPAPIPPELCDHPLHPILSRAILKDPRHRYPNAKIIFHDLEHILYSGSVPELNAPPSLPKNLPSTESGPSTAPLQAPNPSPTPLRAASYPPLRPEHLHAHSKPWKIIAFVCAAIAVLSIAATLVTLFAS